MQQYEKTFKLSSSTLSQQTGNSSWMMPFNSPGGSTTQWSTAPCLLFLALPFSASFLVFYCIRMHHFHSLSQKKISGVISPYPNIRGVTHPSTTWPRAVEVFHFNIRPPSSENKTVLWLKPHSNGPLYSNTAIGTLAVDGWAVTFGTARRGLGQCTNFIIIIRCGTIIVFAL